MTDAMTAQTVCRLCGLEIRGGDDAARLRDEYFYAACAEPAFKGTSEWVHISIGDLNHLAIGAGRAALR